MDTIILYTINCPKCKILELKLQKKNIPFTIIDDVDEVVETGKNQGINGAPFLKVNNSFLNFSDAIQYVNKR